LGEAEKMMQLSRPARSTRTTVSSASQHLKEKWVIAYDDGYLYEA
jgi:hypothetical protein